MLDLTTKKCNRCLEVLPIECFTKQHNAPDGYRYACKACSSKRYKNYYQNTLEVQRDRDRKRYPTERELRHDNHYKRTYGISKADYQVLFEAQHGVCAICHKGETAIWKEHVLPLAVDHDHKTGKVRGLLCNRCNRVLALFDDNIDIMQSAIEYLTDR